MSYTLSRPSYSRRSGLLGVVIGLHVVALLVLLAAKTVVPQIAELPMMVDLLQPVEIQKPVPTKPLQVAKPIAQATPAPKVATPPLESTSNQQPAPSAPLVSPVDSKPTPAPPTASEPVSQARYDADYLRNPAPPYPPLSRRMNEEGRVVLRVSVSPQGSAESVEIRTSSGSQRLDEAAQKTVRNWKFIPAKRGDSAVQSVVLVPIIFKLEQ